jgi:dethiobiotin synthetase
LTAHGLRNDDALALQRNSGVALSYAQVNPFTFAEPTSPHIVSAEEGRPITGDALSAGLRELETLAEWVLVEGRGLVYAAIRDAEFCRLGTRRTAAGHSGGRH